MDENTTGGEYRKKFADLFKTDYEDLVNKKALGESPDVKDYDGYVDFLIKQGEFDHKMNQPFKQFISGVLDLTIVKPLIEMSTGTDMITNEDLTETEKLYKGIGAIIDVATLGYAFAARKAAGGVLSAARVLGLETLSNATAYTTGYVGNELGLPLPLTLILSLGLGVTVSKLGSKFVVKSKTGEVVGEILDETTGDKSLATRVKTVLETGDTKAIETALGTFDLKTMSKEDIKGLYDGLSKSGLKKAEIEQYQKLLLKNAVVPDVIIKEIVNPGISSIDIVAGEAKIAEVTRVAEGVRIAKVEKVARDAEKDKAIAQFGRDAILKLSLFSDGIGAILKKEGITLKQFNKMRMKVSNNLNIKQLPIIKRIRQAVPLPDGSTIFQKVIHESEIMNYFKKVDPYTTIGGCVTKAGDTKNLTTLRKIYNALRLDYKGTKYIPKSDEYYGVIRFKTKDFAEAKIPYGPAMGGDDLMKLPFTGHGLTKAKNGEIIPEFSFYKYVEPMKGATIFRINSKTGIEELVGIFKDGKFKKP